MMWILAIHAPLILLIWSLPFPLRIIGTPGRLMHVVKEMNLKLHSVEYVVFDEADRWEMDLFKGVMFLIHSLDSHFHLLCERVRFLHPLRLFEMGFAEQLQEVIRRLPDSRQTLLFSATLPKLLVEFARAGEITHHFCFTFIHHD